MLGHARSALLGAGDGGGRGRLGAGLRGREPRGTLRSRSRSRSRNGRGGRSRSGGGGGGGRRCGGRDVGRALRGRALLGRDARGMTRRRTLGGRLAGSETGLGGGGAGAGRRPDRTLRAEGGGSGRGGVAEPRGRGGSRGPGGRRGAGALGGGGERGRVARRAGRARRLRAGRAVLVARARGRRAEGDRALVGDEPRRAGGTGRGGGGAARRRPAEDERAPGDHVPGAGTFLRFRGWDRRRAVRARGQALGLRRGGRGHPRVGALRGAPGDPAVLVAAEAGLVGAVGTPRGGGLGTAAVRVRRCRILVEEVRAGLLHGGRRRAGRGRERAAVGGRRPAGARYPGGTVPVPDVSRDGRVRVVPLAGPVVAGCRGWGAHVRRPVSARGWDGGLHIYQTDASPTASPVGPAPFRATPCTLFTRSERPPKPGS